MLLSSLIARIIVATTAFLSTTIVAGWLGFAELNKLLESQQKLRDEQVPVLIEVQNFVRQANLLASQAGAIAQAKNRSELSTAENRAIDFNNNLSRNIQSLDSQPELLEEIKLLLQHQHLIMEELTLLGEAKQKYLALTGKFTQIQDQIALNLREPDRTSISEKLLPYLLSVRASMTPWQANKTKELINTVLTQFDAEGVSYKENTLYQVAFGQENIFTIINQIDPVRMAVEGRTIKSQFIASKLSNQSMVLAARVREKVEQHVGKLEEDIAHFTQVVVPTIAAVILLLFIVVAATARGLIVRIKGLQKSMIDYREGRLISVRDTGNDEVSDLSRHFNDLILEVSSREEKLKSIARTDPLTGALNRRSYMEGLHMEIERNHRHRTPFSIVSIDLDHFKAINDRHGHGVGDEALKCFVHLCSDQLREIDTLARIGGEEFSVLLPDTDVIEAMKVAERIRANIEEKTQPVKFTCSIGLAQYKADETIEDILLRADTALYFAKKNGRNQVQVAQP
jgi:diguanylate cyclase (GGDEF)-like protein